MSTKVKHVNYCQSVLTVLIKMLTVLNLSFSPSKIKVVLKMLQTKILCLIPKRTIFDYLVIFFNRVNADRLERFGPDRTCAEWLLRNGAGVKWVDSQDYIRDYNALPLEGHVHYIQEVDATNSSISHHGFDHFRGCNHITKLVLSSCCYISDDGLVMLSDVVGPTLRHLELCRCEDISENGLKAIKKLPNLRSLVVRDLPYVKNAEKVIRDLKTALPRAHIYFT